MFGWEFPPFNSGGLGVACEGLVKALSKEGLKVLFILPKKLDCRSDFCRFVFAEEFAVPSEKDRKKNKKIKGVETRVVDSFLTPYITSQRYAEIYQELVLARNGGEPSMHIYGSDLFSEVMRYAIYARQIAASEDFDIIHCHDWLCYPAGLAAKKISQKPLVVHIHATEFDRTGGHGVNEQVYQIEKAGFEEADLIIAVSRYTKDIVVKHYGINPQKIRVVHNAVNCEELAGGLSGEICSLKRAGKKIVLFLGRITLQKGPDYFLAAAKKVLEVDQNVIFIVAGSGDMEIKMIEMAADFGIADKVLFAGFLRGKERCQIYQMADLYVLPSVSEPFGITPLESLAAGTPVLISKQSGVSEIISHCLRVDFWDIDEMANKILAVLNYPELKETLSQHGLEEVKTINWQDAGRKCREIYEELLNR